MRRICIAVAAALAHASAQDVPTECVVEDVNGIQAATYAAAFDTCVLTDKNYTDIPDVFRAGPHDMSGLLELSITGNEFLTSLEQARFAGCVDLRTLNLQDNAIAIVRLGAFEGLAAMTTLILINNRISTIEVGAFNANNQLQVLRLSNNKVLDALPADIFAQAPNMRGFYAENNSLTEIDPQGLQTWTSLVNIFLSGNCIRTLSTESYTQTVPWSVVDFAANCLEEITQHYFRGAPDIVNLRLVTNNITSVHPQAFAHLVGLQDLRVGRNNITDINWVFPPALTKIAAQNNLIESLGGTEFGGLENLQTLFLEGNPFERYVQQDFNNHEDLTVTLDAEDCVVGEHNYNIVDPEGFQIQNCSEIGGTTENQKASGDLGMLGLIVGVGLFVVGAITILVAARMRD